MLIAFARRWDATSWVDASRIGPSLGLFNAGRCNLEAGADLACAHLEAPRAQPRPAWRAARTASGAIVLFAGWIDNGDELIASLGPAAASSPDECYGAAWDRWGEDADRRIVGRYAAILAFPDGSLRLSRSPWGGKPLFHAQDASGVAVASVPRPIMAAGWPQRLRETAIARILAYRLDEDTASAFAGIHQVPHGSVVHIDQRGARLTRWYDPLALPPTRLADDAAYVERADALLGEAARAALRPARRAGVLLSGGLDSPLVADALLRHAPATQPLASYTFHPRAEWDGPDEPGQFADERAFVQAFAAARPRLQTRFVDNREIAFDSRWRDLFLAGGGAGPAMAVAPVYHGCIAAAAADRCDWLFSADLGNMFLSSHAPWAWPEYLLRGRWRELGRLARGRVDDPRPIWRRIAALAAMPLLPLPLRRAIRRAVHHGEAGDMLRSPFLRPGSPAAREADHAPGENLGAAAEEVSSRRDWLRQAYAALGHGAEIGAGIEQVFGIRLRDVLSCRPLIEFCATIPTDQFVRGGVTRHLARRLGMGRLPEAQRLNPRLGTHNADWRLRLAGDLPRLREEAAGLAGHPLVGTWIDADAARALLADFPEADPVDPALATALRLDVPTALLAAAFADFVTGRNRA